MERGNPTGGRAPYNGGRSRKESRRRRRGAVIYTPVALLLIVIVVVFGISVFFRVSQIDISGDTKYTTEQILAASGIKTGDNLVLIDIKAVSEKITSTLPFLCEVVIEKIMPDKLDIRVTESLPLAAIPYDNGWWILDQKGRALEKTDSSELTGKIRIDGLDPTSVIAGQVIGVAEGDVKKRTGLIDLLTALQTAGMADKCSYIDLTNIGGISFRYDGRFTVVIGSGEDPDYQLERLADVISQLQPDNEGKIDLTNRSEARFIPDS
jgi:cell division protein FtsQ